MDVISISEDVIMYNILVLNPTHFLCVSNAYNHRALQEIITRNIFDNKFLLCNYIRHNNMRVVEMLLKHPQINPSANFNKAIEEAIRHRSIEAVKLVVQHSRFDEKLGIRLANLENHQENEEIESTSILGASVILNAPEVVSTLLSFPDKFNPSEGACYAMRLAARYNYTDVARVLFKDKRTFLSIPIGGDTMDDVVDDYNPLWHAANHGNEELVKLYLSDHRVPEYCLGEVLERASYVGHANVVKILLGDNRIEDIGRIGGNCLVDASCNGNTMVVKELLKDNRIDPNYEEGRAIGAACSNRHYETVQAFLSDPRVNTSKVLEHLHLYDRAIAYLLKGKQ